LPEKENTQVSIFQSVLYTNKTLKKSEPRFSTVVMLSLWYSTVAFMLRRGMAKYDNMLRAVFTLRQAQCDHCGKDK